MRAVRTFLREEVERKKLIVAQEMTPADEEAEYQRCSSVNDEWNFEVSKIRNARIAKETAEQREFIQSRLELKKIRDAENLAKIEELVRKEKENAATFITRDNIDKAIEEALANPVDYNFAIDSSGVIHKGEKSAEEKKAE